LPKRPPHSPSRPAKTRAGRKRAAAGHVRAETLVVAPRATGEMPTKKEVLAFIASQSGTVGKREIARAFGLSAAQKVELKALLRDLSDEGTVERRSRKLHVPGALPGVVLAEVVSRNADGELVAGGAVE